MGSLTDKEKYLNQPFGYFSAANAGSTGFLHGLAIPGARNEKPVESFLLDYLLNIYIKTSVNVSQTVERTIHNAYEVFKKLEKLKSKKNFGVNPDSEEKIINFFVKKPDLLDTVQKIYTKSNKDLGKRVYISLDISSDETSLALYLHASEIPEDDMYEYIDNNLEPYIKNKFSNYHYLIVDRLPV